jgi:EmrB/QacA subfamily drug resistance transporter
MNPVRGSRRLLARDSNALLIMICLAQFMVILDVSIVNVALPTIRDGLGFSTDGLQWVVNAYTLTFAGFLLLGGRASDLLGRRRVFLGGTALFALASLACALAQDPATMIASRAVQGIGGAVVSAAGLAILTTSFSEGRQRNRALGVWGAMAGLGGTSGVLLGGVLTQGIGWQAIFLVNVPIAAAVLAVGGRFIPAGARETSTRHFDVAGALLVTGGMVALTFGIVRSDVVGWGSPGVLVPLLGGVGLLALFALVEGKLARAPLMPLRIFRLPLLRWANLIVLLLYGAVFAMWFFVALYLHEALHHDALETGVAFLPMTLGVALTASLTPRLVARFGPRTAMTTGMLVAASGLALLTGLSPDGTYLGQVLPGGMLSAVGTGMALVPGTIVAVQGVPAAQSGIASGLVNTSRLTGGALGLAALTTIATSRSNSEIASGTAPLPALTDGYQLAFAVAAAVCVLGAVLAATLIREPRGEDLRVAAEMPDPEPSA